ncbi:hypothetical protein EPNKCIFM_00116 [Klebsiella phage KP13-16]|nr:hypothetical protein EPNKCIFM_00116 [Klebsiella phage KP13-16]
MIKKFFTWFKSLFKSSNSSASVVSFGSGNKINVSQSTVKKTECLGGVYQTKIPDPSAMKKHLIETQRVKSTIANSVRNISSSKTVDIDDTYVHNAIIQSSYSSSDDGGSYSSGSCDSSSSSSCD